MRLDGWDARLAALIADARARPYVLGEHDCFRLACAVVAALTGVDRWPEFRGYRTKREAVVQLARHGSSFEAAGDWFFADARTHWRRGRRGDIACVQTADGEKHLGVVYGGRVALLAPDGLIWVPLEAAICVWRVG